MRAFEVWAINTRFGMSASGPISPDSSTITTPDFVRLPDNVYSQNDNAIGQNLLALDFWNSRNCHRYIVAARSNLL
jgi:hypothetical protein